MTKASRIGKKVLKTSLKVNPSAYLLYAGGGALNSATGGKTKTYNLYSALKGKGKDNRFSPVTQAASGYQGTTPSQGQQRLPVANVQTARVAGTIVKTTVREVVAPVADEVSKGLFGVNLQTLAWTGLATAAGLGGVYVATR